MKRVSLMLAYSCSVVLLFALCVGCSKNAEPIATPNVAAIKFTTFTADTLTFQVLVDNKVLTDTLKSPSSVANFIVSFNDSVSASNLKILNAVSGTLYVDTTIFLRPGSTTISIIQFNSGEPVQLAPPINEPLPAAGNYKVRFQFREPNSGLPFLDSVKCVLRLSGATVDTLVLSQNELSRFYEAPLGSNYNMRIFDAYNDTLIDNTTNTLNSISLGFTDFNTVRLYGIGATNYILQRIY